MAEQAQPLLPLGDDLAALRGIAGLAGEGARDLAVLDRIGGQGLGEGTRRDYCQKEDCREPAHL